MRFALLAALALAALPASARTVIVNANGYSVAADGSLVRLSGIVIDDDGRIIRVLAPGAEPPAPERGEFRLDAKGRTMIPGLIDAHGHVMNLGEAALSVDLTGTRSLDEALDRVRAYAAANPKRPWIVGRGWNQVIWGRDFPTSAELDRAVADRPVYLERVDGHAAWFNSAAARAAKLSAATKDPAGGRMLRGAGGVPSGIAVDGAKELVARVIPPATPAEAEAALAKSLEIMASVGMTGVADMGTDPGAWLLMRMFGDEGRLTARIVAMAHGLETIDKVAPLRPTPWLYQDRLALKGVKLYADGALGSRGAWLKVPYADDPKNRGLQFYPDPKLKNLISRANYLGFQVSVHAIGDAANAQALDAYAEMRGTYGDGLRNRIEHAQILDPADIKRFAELKVIASVQPTHATSDKAMAGTRLGEARLEGAYAWRALINSGARLALGSDFPVEPPNPLYGIHAAVTRRDREGQPPGGWRPQEKLTRTEALAGFTRWAAYAEHGEEKFGALDPGKWADFVLLDRDLMTCPEDDIWRVQVMETWVGGRRVYVKDAPKPAAAPAPKN
jgi:predicted amidohydrolase YtcJ